MKNPLKNLRFDAATLKKMLRRMDERRIFIVLAVLAILFLLIGVVTQEDPVEAFSRTAEKFARATSAYDPDDAVRYTSDSARALILSQVDRVKKARQAGFSTKVEQVKTEVLGQRKNFICALVSVTTVETWPGGKPERFLHQFVLEGVYSSQSWKIVNIVEQKVVKVEQK